MIGHHRRIEGNHIIFQYYWAGYGEMSARVAHPTNMGFLLLDILST